MLFGSIPKISQLDSQSKFQMFTLFAGRHVRGPTWRFYTKLYNFARNLLTKMSTLGQNTHLELGDLLSLFIAYNYIDDNITTSRLYPLHSIVAQCFHRHATENKTTHILCICEGRSG